MCLLGLPGWRYLRSTDRSEQLLLLALHDRALHEFEVQQQNLAARVVNALVKAIR